MQYHQGQVTVERLVTQLRAIGVSISKRQVMRLLIDRQDDVPGRKPRRAAGRACRPRPGSPSTTPARATPARNGCLHADRQRQFRLVRHDGQQEPAELPRPAARRPHRLRRSTTRRWTTCAPARWPARWSSRLAAASATSVRRPRRLDAPSCSSLGIADLRVTPDPVRIATEGALWGAVGAARVPVRVRSSSATTPASSTSATHALCWMHAERLVHKLDTFTDAQRAAQQHVRGADLVVLRRPEGLPARSDAAPARRDARALRSHLRRAAPASPCSIACCARLHANKPELLMVLDHPEIPLHTNGSERDIRCQVIKRKISGGTHSDAGRDCRDAFLGLMQDLRQARHRLLGLSRRPARRRRSARPCPHSPDLIRCRGQPA